MARRKFKIVGIKEPGRVDIFPYGTINLYDQSDDRLEEILNKTGCSFIKPFIDAPAITIKETKNEKTTPKRK